MENFIHRLPELPRLEYPENDQCPGSIRVIVVTSDNNWLEAHYDYHDNCWYDYCDGGPISKINNVVYWIDIQELVNSITIK